MKSIRKLRITTTSSSNINSVTSNNDYDIEVMSKKKKKVCKKKNPFIDYEAVDICDDKTSSESEDENISGFINDENSENLDELNSNYLFYLQQLNK